MEFKYRAVDNRPRPTPTPTPTSSYQPLSTITYVSERSLRGGFPSLVPPPNSTFGMPVNNAGEALRRHLEKEQIRREIIAGEIARRRELEEEVRRELALERGWGIALQRNLAAAEGFSFEERVAMRLNPRLNPFALNAFGVPQPQLPQLMAPVEIKPSPETNRDKVIILAKPDPDLYGAKRKAVTPPAVDGSEHSPFDLKKKPKEEWSCALCQVSATSERGLNEHLQGRKHKAKEAALRTRKIGLDAKADRLSLQPGITSGDINQTMVDKDVVESKNEEQLVKKSQNIEGLKNKNGTATGQEAGRINASTRRKVKFWCEICRVGTNSQIVMESHKKGRKHLTRIKKFSQNDGNAPTTSSVSLEAPGLIKVTDAVDKETDEKITPVLNNETIIKMAESFSDSDTVSPVAETSGDRAGDGL